VTTYSFRRRLRTASLASASILALVVGMTAPVFQATSAHANPTEGFEPGNIISDALFYDGDALTESQIQSFLNQRVPRCTIGGPDQDAGSVWGNTTIASSCLKDARFSTAPRPSNSYCQSVPGGTNELAARIIAKIGRACGISPKVLLVMLAKEQNLIQDTWPTVRQFDFAMGAYCPDTGPGGTANCDPTRVGFANQVYYAGFLLKYYQAHNGLNYHPHQTNSIKWSPTPGCGASQVYIENMATASLYTYTPYQPNRAALDAGWGTSQDRCASYGNRNFYNFYKAWFGSTQGFVVSPRLQGFYDANGGAAGRYGSPAGPATGVGIGVMQEFSGATLYWNQYAGPGSVNGAIRVLFNSKGGVWGYLGYPVGRETYVNGGAVQQFERGTAYWSSATGASAVNGAVRDLYRQKGEQSGYLGFPLGTEIYEYGGVRQEFARGTAYWTSRTGASAVNGAIRALYKSNGAAGGYLGFPVGVETYSNGGARQEFERGTAYWTARTGAAAVNGAIRDLYERSGGNTGYMGFPVGVEVHASGHTRQAFEYATVYYSPRTGASVVNGAIGKLYNDTGGPDGYLGLPKGVEKHNVDYTSQEFERGTIYYSSRIGASAINGAIRAWYLESGGPEGDLGLPIGKEIHIGGQTRQQFEFGVLVYRPGVGVMLEGVVSESGSFDLVEPGIDFEASGTSRLDGVGREVRPSLTDEEVSGETQSTSTGEDAG